MAAMLASIRDRSMGQIALHLLVLDLKNAIAHPGANVRVDLWRFTRRPSGLPTHLHAAAYSSEPAVSVVIPSFQNISDFAYFQDFKNTQQCAVRLLQRLKLAGHIKPSEQTFGPAYGTHCYAFVGS